MDMISTVMVSTRHQKRWKQFFKAPCPCNIAEVRSFLRLVNYYNRFLPNLSTVVHPLNQLLENNHQ